MVVLEKTLLDHLVGHLALQVHHQLQHVIVGLAGEEDLAGVELVDGAGRAPEIDGIVVGLADDWEGKGMREATLRGKRKM